MIHAICVDQLMDVERIHLPICPTSMLLEHSNVSNVSLDREPTENKKKNAQNTHINFMFLSKTGVRLCLCLAQYDKSITLFIAYDVPTNALLSKFFSAFYSI